jgi:2,4-dienoyl-CoA reductase-like NADH-dependent reductase (Old Yellow Enzyme family)
MSSYPHLFSPLRIGNVTVRNRIRQTAHVKLFTSGGVDSQRNVDYQVARAKGEGVDTVVLATGPKANEDLYLALKDEVEGLHGIGDCVAPRWTTRFTRDTWPPRAVVARGALHLRG